MSIYMHRVSDETVKRPRGRPRKSRDTKMVLVAAAVEPGMREDLRAASRNTGRPISEIIRQALTEWLARHRGGHNGE